jgi:hypothetical protein
MLNASDAPAQIEVNLPWDGTMAANLLKPRERFAVQRSRLRITLVYPCWGRILKIE